MRLAIIAIAFAVASAVTCSKNFVNLDGQCILFAEWKNVCADKTGKPTAKCNSYFSGQPQCVQNAGRQDCGWTFGAAAAYCRSFNKGKSTNYGLVKIYNQYQNNAYNTLKGEGQWSLAWIGASCKLIKGADGKTQIPAWVWLADNSAVLDGYTNLDFGVDPSTCQAGQSLNLGGTAYNGKWRAGSGTDRLGDAICAENFNTDAPTPAPKMKLSCPAGQSGGGSWKLFPDPTAPPMPGRLGPTKCYQLLSQIHGATREFTWYEANQACQDEGGQLAKIEDVSTNEFVNSALGGGAYGLQWIGGKCMQLNGAWRFRWTKDNELVAAGYTNFPMGASGGEQEINPCNKKTADNPTASTEQCLSTGSVGYNYQWRTGSCNGKLGDAICEKVPIGGSDDTPGGKGKKGNSGAVAAGVLVPLFIIGGGAAAFMYMKNGGSMPSFGGGMGSSNFGLSNKFISTSTYEAEDGTEFSTSQAGGAASL